MGIKTTKTTLGYERLTPLHIAAATGHVSLYENLLKTAKVKNPKDADGRKPLHHAAYYGCLEMCQFIMLSKKIRDKNPKTNNGGFTPFDYALAGWNQPIVDLLEPYQMACGTGGARSNGSPTFWP